MPPKNPECSHQRPIQEKPDKNAEGKANVGSIIGGEVSWATNTGQRRPIFSLGKENAKDKEKEIVSQREGKAAQNR